jgi:hypothetical protein
VTVSAVPHVRDYAAVMETPNFVTIDHPSDPDFRGAVTFHIPNIYEQISIAARKAQLAGPAGYDALALTDQYRVIAVATLERVIDTAPPAFYVKRNEMPYLSFAKMLELDENQLGAIYQGYLNYRAWFKEARTPDAGAAASAPAQP